MLTISQLSRKGTISDRSVAEAIGLIFWTYKRILVKAVSTADKRSSLESTAADKETVCYSQVVKSKSRSKVNPAL